MTPDFAEAKSKVNRRQPAENEKPSQIKYRGQSSHVSKSNRQKTQQNIEETQIHQPAKIFVTLFTLTVKRVNIIHDGSLNDEYLILSTPIKSLLFQH